MNRVPQLLIVSLFLGLPEVGWACGACIDNQIVYYFPIYHSVLLVLLCWGVCQVTFGGKWASNLFVHLGIIIMRVGFFSVIFYAMVYFAVGSPVLVGLTLLTLYLDTCEKIYSGKVDLVRTRALALVTGIILIGLGGSAVVQRLSRDSFDHARATVFAGSDLMRSQASRFAGDPDFDLERLRPMIREGENNDREWAFLILRRRKNGEDFDRFLPEIAVLPDTYFGENDYQESNAMYFRLWIQAMGVDLDEVIRRVEAFKAGTPMVSAP